MNIGLLINNTDVPARDGRTFERKGPLGGKSTQAAAAGVDDAIAAVDAASAAFPEWAAQGPNHHRSLLLAAADVMERRASAFAEVMAAETGASAGWAGFNVHLAASMLREAAALTTMVRGETIPSDRPGCHAMTVRRPAGVVLGIAPWNAPVILGVRAVATPLACGNTVVLKASEMCPATHRLIGEVFRDAGFPPGVVNVLTNAPEDAGKVVEALILHKAVRRINFTGSTRVGRIIAGLAAQVLKPCLLELGGKAPMIVLDDADLDAAVEGAIMSKYRNMGQTCVCANRIYAQDGIYDAFVEKLAKRVMDLKVGNGMEVGVTQGPLINMEAVEKVESHVKDAVAKGGKIVVGGKRHALGRTFFEPTVIANVTTKMLVAKEETFGPLAPVFRFKNEADVIAQANDTQYGLAAYFYARDLGRVFRVAEALEYGMVGINTGAISTELAPFGGVKESGLGREGSRHGVEEFVEIKYLCLAGLDA